MISLRSSSNASGSRKKLVTPISISWQRAWASRGLFLKDVDILPDSSCLVNRHPPLDPPQYGVLLVRAEIVAGRGLD